MQGRKLFTIGQFAALHEINKKTLMWYDEIGLLKPAVIGENGYRYYTYPQSSILETILTLRELNVSLEQIGAFMKQRSAANLERLLGEKLVDLDQTIAHLQAVRETLAARRQDMHTLMHMDISEISVVEKEKSYLVTVPTTWEEPMEESVEKVLAETKKYRLRRLHDASYGAMISVDSLLRGKFQEYSSLFIALPHPQTKRGLHIQPKGSYLRAFCKGDWENLRRRYEAILAYAERNGLELWGYAYEKGINEIVIDAPEEYITQIEIPVRVK